MSQGSQKPLGGEELKIFRVEKIWLSGRKKQGLPEQRQTQQGKES